MWIEETKATIDYLKYEADEATTNKYLAVWKTYEDTNKTSIPQTKSTALLMAEVNYWTGQGYHISDLGTCGNGLPSNICATFTSKAEGSIFPLYDYMYYSLIVSKDVETT